MKLFLRNLFTFFVREKVTLLFFLLYFAVGVLVFRDYGVSWDELYQDGIGQLNMQYVTGMNTQLLDASNPATFCAPIFEMFVVGTAKLFALNSTGYAALGQGSMYYRHFLNFIAFFIGVIFFYLICIDRFKNKYIGLLGSAMLILSPRIFSDTFYNSKDTVFLAFFTVCMYALLRLLHRPTLRKYIVMAVMTGITFGVRVGASFIPFFLFVFIAGDFIFIHRRASVLKNDIRRFVLFGLVTLCILFAVYPVLWSNPIHNFIYIFQFFAHFPSDIPNLFFGKYVSALHLPWEYVPVWILISTPPLYTVLFVIGLAGVLLDVRQGLRKFYVDHKTDVLLLLWFFVPLTSVIIFRSSLYNSWRHMFFIYPAFILIALHGVLFVKKIAMERFTSRIVVPVLSFVLLANLGFITWRMIRLHPYEHLYFNFLVGSDMKSIRKNFDTDYWGLTYRAGLEFIARYDTHTEESSIVVITDFPGRGNSFILSPKDASRIFILMPWDWSRHTPKYFMTNFFFTQEEPPYEQIHAVTVDGADMLKVYKLPESDLPGADGKFPYK